MKTQNLKFGEAVKHLAQLAGMQPYMFSKQDEEKEKKWKPKKINFGNGTLWKYAQTVGPAYLGAPTHPGGKNEVKTYADI